MGTEEGGGRRVHQGLILLINPLYTSTDYLLGRIENDMSIKQIINEKIDEDIDRLLGNYSLLSNSQKKDLLWYSEALKNKAGGESYCEEKTPL